MGPFLSPVVGVVVAPGARGVSVDDALTGWRDEMGARGCRPGSIDRMVSIVERVQECSAWSTVHHVNYTSAVAFLAARRRAVPPWSGPTYDQAVSTLRTFGEFLRRSGHLPANPLMDLQSCGEKGEDGSRALTPDEARAIISASIDRHLRSRRASGCAPLFWLMMMYTGLRYAEACAVRWKDVDLGTGTLCTDPKWQGNKSRRRDRIPIHAALADLLKGHLDAAKPGSDAPGSPIFPKAPTRHTWHLEREAAGIAKRDGRNRPVTTHSCRKSFCTWLDSQSIPRGLVSRLARHSHTLTEERYIDHDGADEVRAIAALPLIWPSGLQIFSLKARKISCNPDGLCDDRVTTQVSISPMNTFHSQPGQTDGPVLSSGACVVADLNGPGPSVQPSCIVDSRSSDSPVSVSGLIQSGNGQGRTEISGALNPEDRTTANRVALVLAGYLENLHGRGSPKESA